MGIVCNYAPIYANDMSYETKKDDLTGNELFLPEGNTNNQIAIIDSTQNETISTQYSVIHNSESILTDFQQPINFNQDEDQVSGSEFNSQNIIDIENSQDDSQIENETFHRSNLSDVPFDINNDNKVGLEELIFLLKTVSGVSSDSLETKNLAMNSEVSSCGGFNLNRNRSLSEDESEILAWDYNKSTQIVSFINKNVFLNCCGEHSLSIFYDSATNTYEIFEKDSPFLENGFPLRCNCTCNYDFKCDLPDISLEEIKVKVLRYVTDEAESPVVKWSGTLILSENHGSENVNNNE